MEKNGSFIKHIYLYIIIFITDMNYLEGMTLQFLTSPNCRSGTEVMCFRKQIEGN